MSDRPRHGTTPTYDPEYSRAPNVFGDEPDPLLLRIVEQIPQHLPVLDVGAGQGRHSLYLAGRGLDVEALEPSAVATEQLREQAQRRRLTVRVTCAAFAAFSGPPQGYGAILVFGLLPDLTPQDQRDLVVFVARNLARGGLSCWTGFTTADPSLEAWSQGTQVGPDSYRNAGGRIRTYLRPGAARELMPELECVHHREAMGPEHHHGDGVLERHARFEVVFRRT
jgi:cyclopropane fatty-acyl-phospholipid synthase-like methyltransferase